MADRWQAMRSHGRQMASKAWRRGTSGLKGRKADTWPTQGGGTAEAGSGGHKATHHGHMADKVWRRGQSGPKADRHKADKRPSGLQDKWRTKGRHIADNVWRRGQSGPKADTIHKADTWRTRFGGAAKADSRRTRTQGGQAPGTRPEHIAASLFSLRE